LSHSLGEPGRPIQPALIMATPTTTREALLADALGDLGRLLDRTEAVKRETLATRQAMVKANDQLAKQLTDFQGSVNAGTERVKTHIVSHVLTRADNAARRSIEAQREAMELAATHAFQAELSPALHKLNTTVHLLSKAVDRLWLNWLTHAATAGLASAVTWLVLHWN
jgi:hypothetical protein